MVNRKKLSKLFLVLFLALAVGLAACGNNDEDVEQDNTNQDVEQNETDDSNKNEELEESERSEENTYPLTFTDKTGTEITLETKPEKIISVIPSSTEIVFAVGAGDQVVGVSQWDNYPEEVLEIEKVGDMNLNIERIVELDPDVVVADLNNGDSIEALRNAGLKVVVLGAQSLEEVYEDIELAGLATGHQKNAKQVISNMKEEVEQVQDVVGHLSEDERKSVWVEVGPELYSGGEGSFIHEVITLAGGKNIIDDMEGWPQVSEETVIERNPDIIITTYGNYYDDPVGGVLGREAWQSVTAVVNEEIYDLNNDHLTRPGPRLISGIKELASILYPDLFE